jgi:hypothetical protein
MMLLSDNVDILFSILHKPRYDTSIEKFIIVECRIVYGKSQNFLIPPTHLTFASHFSYAQFKYHGLRHPLCRIL